jgi:intracellular sulfur oxidation DsrE/DsrF family protein
MSLTRIFSMAVFLLAGLLPLSLPTAHASPVAAKVGAGKTAITIRNRIVIQINEDDVKKWNAVLININNIQADLGKDKVAIAVVAIGYGLGMLTADALTANQVQDAIATGVEFIACGNSMKAQQFDQSDLVTGVTVAASGYVELMRRQQQGWAYLRP